MIRVLHLVGSPTSDFHAGLSVLYARDALGLTAASPHYEPVLAYVSPDGRWCFPTDLSPDSIAAVQSLDAGAAIGQLAGMGIDVALPQLFCLPGMTTYRGLFEVLGIPFVGNTARTMTMAADKPSAKALVAAAGVAVPAGEVLRPGLSPTVVPPAVVKPADSDNSLGVTLVRNDREYGAALASAHEQSDRAMVETFVPLGREVRCGVVARGPELVCLPLEEYGVDPYSKPVRLAADKLRRDSRGDLELVAKDAAHAWIVGPDDPVTHDVWDAALACHRALDCRHYSLFDFRIDPDGRPWFLEASLYCSYARQSVIPVMARSAGIELDELLDLGVAAALDHDLATAGPTKGTI